MLYIFSGFALIGIIGILTVVFWRSRNRLVWERMRSLEQKIIELTSANAHDFEEAFKQQAMSEVDFDTRLPLAMPSQHGEELLLWNFFGRKRSGFFVEVGGFDGVNLSNTYFFEAIGWDGVVVEAVDEYSANAAVNRPFSQVLHAAVGDGTQSTCTVFAARGEGLIGAFSHTEENKGVQNKIISKGGRLTPEEVPCKSLNDILGDVTRQIDFVSIDVEGAELKVLEGFDIQRYRPAVLVIEDNSHGQDRRVTEWLGKHDYFERYRRGVNVFYTKGNERRQFLWAASKGSSDRSVKVTDSSHYIVNGAER